MIALTFESAGAWVVIISSISGAIIAIINTIMQRGTTNKLNKVSGKVEAVADAAAAASLKVEEVKVLQQQTTKVRDEKLDEIHQEVKKGVEAAGVAYQEANDVNKKIAGLHEVAIATANRVDRHSEALDPDKPRTPTRPIQSINQTKH